MSKRPPARIKKDLVAKRTELRRAEKKLNKEALELNDVKRRGQPISVVADREAKRNRAAAEIRGINEDIKVLEIELAGDWVPKSWGVRNAG